MGMKLNKLSPTLNRIVILSVLLTLVSQIVLVVIGLTYAYSINESINAKQSEFVTNQFQQNVLDQLKDINNLLLLLQTPEFSDFFRNKMSLQDDVTVTSEKQKLLDKMKGLIISPDFINAIYFIGANVNEQSYVKITNAPSFEELPRLRMEAITNSKLDSLFLRVHDQLTIYTEDDLNKAFRTDSRLLFSDDIEALQTFISRIKGHLILTNGNINGIFIVIDVNALFFERAMPRNMTGEPLFSIIGSNNRILWSNVADPSLRSSIETGVGGSIVSKGAYTNTLKDLQPYQLRMVYSEKQSAGYRVHSILLLKMIGLSILTLLTTLFVSLFYLKKVFQSFRVLSKRFRKQAMSDEMVLQAIPEDLIKRGFHSISMRNKLIVVLFFAVCIPTISDSILYSHFLNQDVRVKMETSMNVMGKFFVASVGNRVRFVENTLNDISVSQNFLDYINNRYYSNIDLNYSIINLSMFPGLNDIAYFVLLDKDGNCIYSSIFSGNKSIFNTEVKYLLKQEEPYWISDYKDVFNHSSTAIVKRIDPNSDNSMATYLLMVPKESIFENNKSGLFNASYVISDKTDQVVYESRSLTDLNSAEALHFSQSIPQTNWSMSIHYVFNEVIEKNRVYQEQFLLIIFIVFLLSVAAAFKIADILARPIKQLKETMLAAGKGDFSKGVAYDENNEIGDIIRTYNRMIGQLDRTIRQNMSILEENTQNKIRENELISMKTRAELQMLQAQINPHFLYNTLEAVNVRGMKTGNHEISTIVSALADLFRYSIAKGGDTARLEQELNHAANYMSIQQIRLGRSFEADFDVPEELKGVPVLRFILQPVIENSIKHGFVGWEAGGLIRISVSRMDNRLLIQISDNGIGMDQQMLNQLKTEMERELGKWTGEEGGIGLNNVYHRLKLYYKDQMSINISSELMKGTVITITFPLDMENGTLATS